MEVSADIFILAAQKFLCCGKKKKKKKIPASVCFDMAVQIQAVDLGLKPSVLYDINGACAEQILQYVSSLQEAGVLTKTLQIISISGSTFIVNPSLMKAHLGDVIQKRIFVIVDVCPWREHPSLIELDSTTEQMVQSMLDIIIKKEDQCSLVTVNKALYGQWNLCTLFGILLGYPALYWFDQSDTFENCLSMVPLVVNKVLVCWQMRDGKHCSCLYSFSIPEMLLPEVYTCIKQWQELLKSRFSQQTTLTELSFLKETVILPSVAL